jgi:hypothetical protein
MSDDDIDVMIEAGCRVLGIPVRDEWREMIRLHLVISLDHTRHVGEFELPEDANPAPIFTA